jgi:hypothetical protein
MAPQSVTHSEAIAAFIPDLERLFELALVRARPLRCRSRFEGVMICSITKSFTSTGLALPVDKRHRDWMKMTATC